MTNAEAEAITTAISSLIDAKIAAATSGAWIALDDHFDQSDLENLVSKFKEELAAHLGTALFKVSL